MITNPDKDQAVSEWPTDSPGWHPTEARATVYMMRSMSRRLGLNVSGNLPSASKNARSELGKRMAAGSEQMKDVLDTRSFCMFSMEIDPQQGHQRGVLSACYYKSQTLK